MLDENQSLYNGRNFPDGSTFTNVIEPKKVLLTYEDNPRKEFESLLAYHWVGL